MKIVLQLDQSWPILEYNNFDFSRLIGNHFCTACENLVRFGIVTLEF